MRRIAVLDIGGTKIKSGLFEDGILKEEKETDTNAATGAESVMKNAMALLETYRPFDAAGISTCGQVDASDGSIHYASDNMPGYTGTPLKALFESHFHVPCAVENDVYAAARGEAYKGAAEGASDFICLTYGTGIGGGIFLNGKPYYGNGYNAGSMLGGMITHAEQADKPWLGSYEYNASTTALVKNAQQYDPAITDGRILFSRMDDDNVRKILDQWIHEVAVGICSLIHVYNVPLVILGGGIMEQPYILPHVQNEVSHLLIDGFRGTQIKAARLGNKAGMYGVYAMAEHSGK